MSKNPCALALCLCLAVAGSAEAGWEEGVAAFKSGDYGLALQEFEALVKELPEWHAGHYMLGQTLRMLKRPTEALIHLTKARDLEPGQVTYQLALARSYLDNRRYSEASLVLEQVSLSALPEAQRGTYYEMAAVAFEQSGQSERALSMLDQAAQHQPGNADAYYRYGVAAFNAGRATAAVAALEQAVRLDPDDATKQQSYLNVLIRSARDSQGEAKTELYQRAVAVAANLTAAAPSFENLLSLGAAQLGAQQYAAAAETSRQAIAKKGDDWLAHFYLGQALTSLESYADAESVLATALAKTSRTSDQQLIWRQIGFINDKLRNYPKAKEAYRQAGDTAGLSRVEDNERIAAENAKKEEEKELLRQLQEGTKQLEDELDELEGYEAGVSTDSRTGLLWTRRDNSADIDWDGARRYCEGLSLADYSDWRLATVGELAALYDESESDFCGTLGASFTCHVGLGIDLTGPWVWSATMAEPSRGWVVNFDNGDRLINAIDYAYYGRVLCVRGR